MSMVGEELVEKLINDAIEKIAARFEATHGFAAFEETKAVMVSELRRTGEELKEVIKVKTLGQMELLDIVARGGAIFVKDVDESIHHMGAGADFRWIVEKALEQRRSDDLRIKKARVTIIVDPVKE